MPAALSLSTAARNSSHVAGGAVMPACVNRSLLYQMPTMPRSYGMPYCLPSYWYMPIAPAFIVSAQSATSAVMSLSETGVDLLGHAAAAPRLEEVGNVAALDLGRELRLERVVLEDGDLDRDVRVRGRVTRRPSPARATCPGRCW